MTRALPALPWFRMWAEAVDDAKLRMLSFEDRWHFVALLCLKCQGVLNEKDPQVMHSLVAIKLGLTLSECETVMKRFVTLKLVSARWQPLNWGKRQFKSDSSTSRVRALRKRRGNVTETVSESESESDTDLKKATRVAIGPGNRREEAKQIWPRVLAAIQAEDLRKDFPPDSEVGRIVNRIGGWQNLGLKPRHLHGQTEQQFLNAYTGGE
jgi:hypothetical protein